MKLPSKVVLLWAASAVVSTLAGVAVGALLVGALPQTPSDPLSSPSASSETSPLPASISPSAPSTASSPSPSPSSKPSSQPSPTPQAASSCGATVNVSGSTFTPSSCALVKEISGAACGTQDQPASCPPSYKIQMTSTTRSGIQEMLIQFNEEPRDGQYTPSGSGSFGITGGLSVWRGNGVVGRDLTDGSLTLTRVGSQYRISFDLTFTGNIRIRGSGTVPLQQVALP